MRMLWKRGHLPMPDEVRGWYWQMKMGLYDRHDKASLKPEKAEYSYGAWAHTPAPPPHFSYTCTHIEDRWSELIKNLQGCGGDHRTGSYVMFLPGSEDEVVLKEFTERDFGMARWAEMQGEP